MRKQQKPLVSKSISERGMIRGWLPEKVGAGSLGGNGGGDSAAVPPHGQPNKLFVGMPPT